MFKVCNYVKSFRRDITTYFKVDAEDIGNRNLMMLRFASGFLIVVIMVLCLLAPLVMPDWRISNSHILYWVFAVLFYAFIEVYNTRKTHDYRFIQSLCIVFLLISQGFVIEVSIFPYPDSPSTLLVICFMTIPNLFILKPQIIWSLLLLGEVLFVSVAPFFKSPQVVPYDIFTSLASIIFAVVVSIMTCSLRIHENTARMKYQKLSRIDMLTTLLNKKTTESYCSQYLEEMQRGEVCALFIIDVDNFKEINDRLGHKKGDEVLFLIGLSLTRIFREFDVLGRIGGDEFLVLMKNIGSKNIVTDTANRILKELEAIKLESVNESLSCSIGIQIHGGNHIKFSKLYAQADHILYSAKRAGKSCFMINDYEDQMKKESKQPLLIVDDSDLSRALLKNCFEADFEVMEANSGSEALSYLNKFKEDIAGVLLDIQMPDLNGYEVLEIMKRDPLMKQIPVLMITAGDGQEEKALELGALDIIYKPFHPKKVEARVKELIQSHWGKIN